MWFRDSEYIRGGAPPQYMELFDGTDDCRERDTTTKHTKLSSFTNEDQVG